MSDSNGMGHIVQLNLQDEAAVEGFLDEMLADEEVMKIEVTRAGHVFVGEASD